MSTTETPCTLPPDCPKCQSRYRMVVWQWLIFGLALFLLLGSFFFSVFAKPKVRDETSGEYIKSTSSKKKLGTELELFSTKIKFGLFSSSVVSLVLLLTVVLLPIEIPECQCPKCPVDFPVSDFQIGLLSGAIGLPILVIGAYHTQALWKSPELAIVQSSSGSGGKEIAETIRTEKKIVFIQVALVLCVLLLILFIILGFFQPQGKWVRVKEKFFFEVSPERKKCLEEQVSRKNFGKPRECSCCGKGTVGGIPPNYDQWLNIDEDTGSRWHRPENVDYVNTFSNGQEAVCNSCGPPSYKMYL